VRRLANRSIVSNPGNETPCSERDRRRGADPPKNESGTTDTVSSYDRSAKSISSGNGPCIAAQGFSGCEDGSMISDMRSLCASATIMLSRYDPSATRAETTRMRGKGGQTSRVSKDDDTPSSTDVYQLLPFICTSSFESVFTYEQASIGVTWPTWY
jgi:hypothetical protein